MDPLTQLLSFSFIIFSLLIGGITYILRIIIEFFWKSAPNNKIWEDIILPIVPMLMGIGVAYFATMYPYPVGFNAVSGRLAFGGVAGLFSGLLYRLIKSTIKQKINSLISTNTPNSTTTIQISSTDQQNKYMGSDLYK